MLRSVLSAFLFMVAIPAFAAPTYECTTQALRHWEKGALEHMPAMDERVASGVFKFRLDPDLGLQYPPLAGDGWDASPYEPVAIVTLEGMGEDPAKLLATTQSGADSIRITTEGDTLAFVWTTWITAEAGTCIIIESTTK